MEIFEKKNIKLSSKNKLLKEMIKSSFEKYLEAIKSLKKKAKDTNQLFLTEKADFDNFKENIKTEMKSFLEKVRFIFSLY